MGSRLAALLLAMSILGGLTPCIAQDKDYLGTFETVWGKVNETYYDSTFGGVDWREAHDRYQPQIAAAESDEEFYRLVNKMLWELGVSHAALIPPGSFARYEPLVFAEGSPGVDIRLLSGEALITSVKPASPADTAGLRPGYVVHAVDGVPVEEIVQEAEATISPPSNDRGRTARITKAILSRILGTPGSEVSIVVSDERNKRSEKKMVRTKRSGVAVGPNRAMFMAIEFEAKRLGSDIGYVRLNTLQPPLAAQISGAIKSMGDLRGMILDLRGNSGGEVEKMPDLFLNERTLLYVKRTREGEAQVFCDPVADAFKGPLVLLVDATSGSASEVLAACLQAIGRAVVVGEQSPGSATESDVMIFQDGAVFIYPVAQIRTAKGTVLEGQGVVPDIEVALDRAMLLEAIDSQLSSAISYIEKQGQK